MVATLTFPKAVADAAPAASARGGTLSVPVEARAAAPTQWPGAPEQRRLFSMDMPSYTVGGQAAVDALLAPAGIRA